MSLNCPHCGTVLQEEVGTCPACGLPTTARETDGQQSPSGHRAGNGSVGWSPRIHDPAFANYLSNSCRWSAIFSFILAVIAVVGFALAGALPDSSLENPAAMLIGLAVGSMLVVVALMQLRASNQGRSWDGRVVDKRVQIKCGRPGGPDEVRVYTVVVLSDSGRNHFIRSEDDGSYHDYFSIGDRVRYHAGLRSYEKYDKSHDSIIFCNVCGALQPIASDYCSRCDSPLLK